jgi:hypothetical protein
MEPAEQEMTQQDPTSSSPKPSSLCGEDTCHIMPCNIDYTGMAPTHIFFKPVPLEDGIYASSFRGRGLLAAATRHTRNTPEQVALEAETKPYLLSLKANREVHVKASIDNILEWHHEYSSDKLKYRDAPSRLQQAMEWSQVARSVSVPKSMGGKVLSKVFQSNF